MSYNHGLLLNPTVWNEHTKLLFGPPPTTTTKTLDNFFTSSKQSTTTPPEKPHYRYFKGEYEKCLAALTASKSNSPAIKSMKHNPILLNKVAEINAAANTIRHFNVPHGNNKAEEVKETVPQLGPFFSLGISMNDLVATAKKAKRYAAIDEFFISASSGNAIEGVLIVDPQCYHGISPKCPNGCEGSIHSDGRGDFVVVSGLYGDIYALGRKYQCQKCKHKFSTTTDSYWETLPYDIRKGR